MKKMVMTFLAAAAINATAAQITWTGTEKDVLGVVLGEWMDDYSLYYSQVQFFFACSPPLTDYLMEVELPLELGTFDGSPNANWNWAHTAPSSPKSDWEFKFNSEGPIEELIGLAIFETTAQFREEYYDVQYFWTWACIDSSRSLYNGPYHDEFYEFHEPLWLWSINDLPNFIIIPEPTTGLLALAGAATLLLRRRRVL